MSVVLCCDTVDVRVAVDIAVIVLEDAVAVLEAVVDVNDWVSLLLVTVRVGVDVNDVDVVLVDVQVSDDCVVLAVRVDDVVT